MRRLRRIVGYFLVGLVLLVVGVYVFRGPLFGRMIADRIEQALAEELGGRFSVARVEGSYLFDLAIVGLRTEEPPEGALRRLDWGRAVVTYDLRRMLKGDPQAIRSVLLSNAVIEADLTRETGEAEDAPLGSLPTHLPRLEIYGDLAVTTPIGDVRAEQVAINTSGTDVLALRARRLTLPEPFGPSAGFAGTLHRTAPGAFLLSSDTPVAGVTLTRVSYDGVLDAELLVGRSPVALTVAPGEARLTSDALDLARLPPWTRSYLPGDVELPAEAVAAVDVRVPSFRPLRVAVAATAPRLRWRDLDLAGLAVDLRHDAGRTVVRTASAEGHGAIVDLRDVVIEPELPYLVGDVGQAIVRIPDLRDVEPRLDRRLSFTLQARGGAGGGFEVVEARLEGEGIVVSGTGRVTPPGDPARWRETRLEGSYSGSVRDFAAGRYAFTGEVGIEGGLVGTADRPELDASVEGAALLVEGRRLDRVALHVRLAGDELRITDMRVQGESGTLRAEGLVDLRARALRDGSYEIDVHDLEGFLGLFPGAPAAEGSLTGSGSLVAGPEGFTGTADLAVQGFVYDGRELGAITIGARADGREVSFETVEARGPWGSASAAGVMRWEEGWARVDRMRLDAERVHAELNRAFRITWNEEEVRAAVLDLSALGGTVRGVLVLRGGSRLECSMRGEELDLARLDERLAGRMNVDVTIDGERYGIDASAPAARYSGREAALWLKARSGLDGIIVERFVVRAGDALALDATAHLPWRFDGERFERVEAVESNLTLEARAYDIPSWHGLEVGSAVVDVKGAGRDLTAKGRLREMTVGGFGLRGETWFEIASTPGGLSATAGIERSDFGDAEASVRGDRGFDWTRPDEVRAALEAAELDGGIALRVPDVGVLRRFVPGLLELAGAADGTLALRGPLTAPEIEGTIHVAGIDAKPGDTLPRLRSGRGQLRFDGRTLTIVEFTGELGYAPVGASGTVDLVAAGGPRFDLRLTGQNALLASERDIRVRADVDVALTGTPAAMELAGRVVITDALYARPVNLLARGEQAVEGELGLVHIRSGVLSRTELELDVTANKTIRVRTPTLWGDLSCDLRVRGTGELPAPEGRVFFRDLLVELPATSGLKVDRGEVNFPPGQPFDPRLDIGAHTRIKGYDLFVRVDGPVSDLDLQVASRPSLPQDDAVILLLTGSTREELEREGVEQAALEKLAVFLGERLVSRMAGPRDPDERTFFERFRFSIGKEVSRSGEDTIEGEFEASDRLFLRVERDRFDAYNGGVVWRIRFK